jgi:hypothetical protein
VHIGSLLERNTAGVVFAPQLEDLISATDTLLSNYEKYQAAARPCAESYFDLAKTVEAYDHLYHQLWSG